MICQKLDPITTSISACTPFKGFQNDTLVFGPINIIEIPAIPTNLSMSNAFTPFFNSIPLEPSEGFVAPTHFSITSPPVSLNLPLTTSSFNSNSASENSIHFSIATPTVTLNLPLTTSSISTNSPSVSSSNPTSSSSRPLPLGPIIGGLLAALALILLSLFLLLKRRSLRGTTSRAETDPQTLTPFGFNIRERLGSHVGVNDGPNSATAGQSFPLMIAPTAVTANHAFTQDTFPIVPRKLGACATYAPIQDERIHLAPTYTSNTNTNTNTNQGHFQSNLSDDLTTNGITREEGASHTPIYISNPNETRFQVALANISTNSDHTSVWDSAPPAYDSLSSRISHANSSQLK